MYQYSTSDHELSFENEHQTLRVKKKSTGTTEQDFSLTGETYLKLYSEGGYYKLEYENCSGSCYTQAIDLTPVYYNEDPLVMSGGGVVGTIDIRDAFSYEQWFYDIKECPVRLRRINTNLFHILSPCSGSCTSPNTSCRNQIYP